MKTAADRRHSRRVELDGGLAVSRHRDEPVRYEVRNVSTNGACLVNGPLLAIGEPIEIDLRWPGIGYGQVVGTVVRRNDLGQAEMGIEFRDRDGDARELIEDLVTVEMLRRSDPAALVVTSDSESARSLTQHLQQAGRRTMLACTPLDAIHLLTDPWGSITTVFVAVDEGGPATMQYLAEEFPTLRRIAIVPPTESTGEAAATISAMVDGAHSSVPVSCDPLTLQLALEAQQ